MTVQVDSQRMTDDIMWYIDMCYINNSISWKEDDSNEHMIDMLCPPPMSVKILLLFVCPLSIEFITQQIDPDIHV